MSGLAVTHDELAGRRDRLAGGNADSRSWARDMSEHHPKLTTTALHVAKSLQLYADENLECWPSRATLAKVSQLTLATVTRAIRELLDAGVIERIAETGTGRTVSRYRLLRGDSPIPLGERRGVSQKHPWGDVPRARVAGSTSEVPAEVPRPPNPPEGGDSTSVGLRHTPPPRRPSGGRKRDRDHWLADLRQWCIREKLPVEHLAYVEAAMGGLRPVHDRAGIVAYLEKWTAWRCEPEDDTGVDQLTLEVDE